MPCSQQRAIGWFCAWLAGMLVAVAVPAAEDGIVKPDPDALIALLQQANYRELDARVNEYLQAYEADTNNEAAAVTAIEAFERGNAELEPNINAWVAAYPQSYAARLARGLYYSRLGWNHRGNKYFDETRPERVQAMHDDFGKATADLRASLKLSTKPALSYAYLINIALADGGNGEIGQLFEQVSKLDPYNARGRRIYMNSLHPEWGGSYAVMAAFVDATRRNPDTPKLREIVAALDGDLLCRHAIDSNRAQDYKAALGYYDRALALREDARFLFQRSSTLTHLDRHRDAVADLTRAIELNPNLTEAYKRRATINRIIKGKETGGASDRSLTKEVIADFRIAAERGDADSQNSLGTAYFTGTGVRKNDQEAARWLRLAAIQGDSDAQSGYGYLVFHGMGTPRNEAEAIEWWRRSALQGNPDGFANLPLWESLKIRVMLFISRIPVYFRKLMQTVLPG